MIEEPLAGELLSTSETTEKRSLPFTTVLSRVAVVPPTVTDVIASLELNHETQTTTRDPAAPVTPVVSVTGDTAEALAALPRT